MKLFLPATLLLLLLFWPTSGLSQANVRPRVVKAAQVNGTWRGSAGEFRLWALHRQRLRIEFAGIYVYDTPGGPIANLGYAHGVVIIDGETAVFKPEGTQDLCTITMTFKRHRLMVDEHGECGFGKHVTSAGTYRRVSTRKPQFGAKL